MKEKLGIALDRGLAEKAAPLLTALSALTPADPDLPELEARLTALQQEQAAHVKKKQAEAKPKEDPAQARARRDAQKRKIGELLEQANTLYQQEKYEPALERIAGLLELEPGHTEALDLKEQVERAKHLADELKEEEERRRAADAAAAKPAPVRNRSPHSTGRPLGRRPHHDDCPDCLRRS